MSTMLHILFGASLAMGFTVLNEIREIDQKVDKINKVLDKNNAESSCYVDEDGLFKLNTEPKLPLKVAVDTELVSMSVSGDKMIQN